MKDTKGWVNGLRCPLCKCFCDLDEIPVTDTWRETRLWSEIKSLSKSRLGQYREEFPCRYCGARLLKVTVVRFSKKEGWKAL